MRFSVERNELLHGLSTASRSISSRSTLPVLSGILITADEERVVLNSTDLEISIKTEVTPRIVEYQGSAVLPGKLLTDIVKTLPDEPVDVSVDGDSATIKTATSSFTLRVLPVDEFPGFPEILPETMTTLAPSVLTSALKSVGKAVSKDEARAVLTGVLMSKKGNTIKFVATDSYRLGVNEQNLEGEQGDSLEVVVPARTLEEVTRLAASTKQVTVGATGANVVFSFGETVFVTRRIEGTFPNYQQLIPESAETTASADREELVSAVRRVSLLAQHNSPVRISVSIQDQSLTLTTGTNDVGNASTSVSGHVSGSDVEIAFNPAFLLDGLTATECPTVVLDVVSPLKPGVIRTPENTGFLYLLMPVRVG